MTEKSQSEKSGGVYVTFFSSQTGKCASKASACTRLQPQQNACILLTFLLLLAEGRTLRTVAVLRLGAVTTTDLNAVQGAVVLTTSVVVTSGDVALDAVVYLIHIPFASFGLAPLI